MRIAFLLLIAWECSGATWYVRPGVYTSLDGNGHPIPTAGVYGTQDGTSYANAWNGITSVIWGVSGVNTGDTLYVCGTNIFKFLGAGGDVKNQGTNLIGASGVTIRMDQPGDTGYLFGGYVNPFGAGAAYLGPDANGVYRQTLLSSQTLPPQWWISGSNILRLKVRTSITWADGLGGQFLDSANGTTNYIQLPGGSVPTTVNMASSQRGWAFDLNYKSNITFQSCHFIDWDFSGQSWGCMRHTIPISPFTTATHDITFNNCTFFDSATPFLYPGEDGFSFLGCEAARTPSIIYTLIHSTTTAPQRVTVSNCWIHDIGTTEYHDIDNNAIGIQGGSYHTITHNTFSNTGPAIVLWTGGNVAMLSNTISYNFIINGQTNVGGNSAGISISGDNAGAPPGKRLGHRVFSNIIHNIDHGPGISGNLPDYIEILNNTISTTTKGVDLEVSQAGTSANAKIENNILYNNSVNDYYIIGPTTPIFLTIDYNLQYPCAGTGLQCAVISPSQSRGTHNVFADPQFASFTPTSSDGFKLKYSSPAIGVGTPVGLTTDFAGNPIPGSNPDIGAFQFVPGTPPPNLYYTAGHL